VCYALAIYILNLFLAFLQPRFDPSVQDDLAADEVEEGAPGLPGSEPKSAGGIKGLLSGFRQDGDEEFRPFIRRLPGMSISAGLIMLSVGEDVGIEKWLGACASMTAGGAMSALVRAVYEYKTDGSKIPAGFGFPTSPLSEPDPLSGCACQS
jgi:hypothetical protein